MKITGSVEGKQRATAAAAACSFPVMKITGSVEGARQTGHGGPPAVFPVMKITGSVEGRCGLRRADDGTELSGDEDHRLR